MQPNGIAKRAFLLVFLGVMSLAATTLIACSGGSGNSSSSSSPQTRLLFVADSGSSVLVYNAPFTTGQSATAVLGGTGEAPAASTFSDIYLLTVDSSGNLYVADSNNCRVLQFSPPFTTGMAASLAIGPASGPSNLTTGCGGGSNGTTTGLAEPAGVAVDSAGNLWVADSGNNRVLKYPAPITAGDAATVALGQSSLGGGYQPCPATPSASTVCFPTGLAFDSGGNLWVADNHNNRVLMYSPANLVTGGFATVELGQPAATAFTSNNANNGGVSAASLYQPFGLAFDSAGNLWVADTFNSRVLMYANANLGTNGAAATLELGQPSATAFTSNYWNNGGIGASTLSSPFGLAFDSSGRIFVTDGPLSNFQTPSNNRTLVFAPPFGNGMSATLVLGQTGFTTNTCNSPLTLGSQSTAAALCSPSGIATSF